MAQPVVPGQMQALGSGLPPIADLSLYDWARTISRAIWGRCFGGRRRAIIQSMTEPVEIKNIPGDVVQHLVYIWQTWGEPTHAELILEPWRGRYDGPTGRMFKIKTVVENNEVVIINLGFCLLLPR